MITLPSGKRTAPGVHRLMIRAILACLGVVLSVVGVLYQAVAAGVAKERTMASVLLGVLETLSCSQPLPLADLRKVAALRVTGSSTSALPSETSTAAGRQRGRRRSWRSWLLVHPSWEEGPLLLRVDGIKWRVALW